MVKFFGRFRGLARKFHMAFLLTAIIPATVAGVVGIYYSLDALKKETLQHLNQEVTGRARGMAHFFDQLTSELLYLSRSDTLYELVNQPAGQPRKSLHGKLESDFAAFAKTYPYIYQIRFIGADGREFVRVDRQDKRLVFVPDSGLQMKRDRYYFQESISIEAGQVYVSPLDLNVEHGQVENPERPVIRFATPVVDRHGEKQGVLIINLHAAYLLEQLEHLAGGRSGISYLFDRSGFFLSRSADETKTQAADYKMESVETLAGHLPRELLARILQGAQGTEVAGEWIAAFAPIVPGSTLAERSDDIQSWAVGLIYPRARLLEAVFNLYLLYGVLALSLMTSAAAGYLLARHLLRPLQDLSNETEALARGDFSHRISIRGNDEIADLGQRFNVMADNLEQSYQALEGRKGELEREVGARTADLERERARLAAVIDNTADGIMAVDPDGRIELANVAAARMLGQGQQALLGMELAGIWPQWPEQTRHDAGPARHDLTVGERLLSVNIAPMLEAGQPLRHILVLRDVSEERRMHDHRRELDRQMFQMEKMTTLGEIAMGLAHEIGNPLAGMKAVSQLLLDEDVADDHRRYLVRLLGEIDRLSAFLRTFHGFAAPQDMHPVACDIGQALDDVLLWTRNQARSHQVEIVYAPCSGLVPELWADPGQLKQVLLNLVINAIHAMPAGGRIEIGMCTGCDARPDDVSAAPRRMRFCVRDNGSGIPADVLPRIFDPFFTTRSDGSGLGLAVVKKIVMQHGADIRISTSSGEGTVFEIDWPIAPNQPAPAAEPSSDGARNTRECPRNA